MASPMPVHSATNEALAQTLENRFACGWSLSAKVTYGGEL
jgi:translation initiation factor 1 (eIF-1/SUI1)